LINADNPLSLNGSNLVTGTDRQYVTHVVIAHVKAETRGYRKITESLKASEVNYGTSDYCKDILAALLKRIFWNRNRDIIGKWPE